MTATTVTADSPVITELARSLTQAANAIRTLERTAATMHGISRLELAAIRILLDRPTGVSPVELAHELDLHTGQGARLIEHLHRTGLAETGPVGRVTLVTATAKARSTADRATQAVAVRLADLGLSDDQLGALSTVCRALVLP